MSRERQRKQSEEVRNQILSAARQIIEEEGLDALSVRRITKRMDYSAGIVYHYFKDKEEILTHILAESYGRLLRSVAALSEGLTPEDALRASIGGYIACMLERPSEYKAIMLSTSPAVLAFNTVLGEADLERRPPLRALVRTLEEGIASDVFAACDVGLTACSIWSAMFGLLMRLIIEGENVSPQRRAQLVDNQINLILKGLKSS